MELIRSLFDRPVESKTIIFSSSKQKVKELAFALKRMKFRAAAMHSDLEQAQREEVMLDFKNGKIDLLVATDIVARGIDIEDIGTVINFDVPHDPEDYIHRIGRTARASATGRAITFVSEKEQGKFHRIESFIEREIPKNPLPERLGVAPEYRPDDDRGTRGRSHGGRSEAKKGRNEGRGEGNRGSRDRRRGRDKRKEEAATPAAEPARSAAAVAGEVSAEPSAAAPQAPNGGEKRDEKRRRRHRGGRNRRRKEGGTPAPETEKQDKEQ